MYLETITFQGSCKCTGVTNPSLFYRHSGAKIGTWLKPALPHVCYPPDANLAFAHMRGHYIGRSTAITFNCRQDQPR